MGDEPRHYRTERPGESSVGYARNDRDRPFGKRDGWLGPPGYSRGSHPPAPFSHRRGRFDPSHVGSRDYAAQDRLQPVRPSFSGRGVPPPYHYAAGGPRRGHGIYSGPGADRGSRPYHVNEPRGSVYSSEPFSSVPSGRAAHRDNSHDWDNSNNNRDAPSGWDVDRDPPPADWSRNAAIPPSGTVSVVRAPLRAAPRYAVADVEAGELPTDGVRAVKTSQWDKGGPLQRTAIQSPNSVHNSQARAAKVLAPFNSAAILNDSQNFPEQPVSHEIEIRPEIRPEIRNEIRASVVEDQGRAADIEQPVPIPDVKLEPRNADGKGTSDSKPGDELSDRNRSDAGDGEFPSPAPASGAAGDDHPRTGRRRGWGQGLKRLSSATSVKADSRSDDPSGNAASMEEAEKSHEQGGPEPLLQPSTLDVIVEATAGISPTTVLASEPSESISKVAAVPENSGTATASAAVDATPVPLTPSSHLVLLPEPSIEPPPFTKAEILTLIEGVDSELSEFEKQLAALSQQVSDLVAEEELVTLQTEELARVHEFVPQEQGESEDVEGMLTTDESDSEDVDPEEELQDEREDTEPNTVAEQMSAELSAAPPAKELTWRSVVDKVLHENQAAVNESHNAVIALGCPNELDRSLDPVNRTFASAPETVAQLNELVKQFLLERHKLVTMKQEALANDYLSREELYVGKHHSEAAAAAAGPSVRKAPEPGARSTRSSHHASDSVRSELEYKLVLQQKQAISELEEMTKLPDYILDPWQRRWKTFNTRNNLVEDPEKELEEDRLFKENWTNVEKRHFREQFLLYPKDFGSISENMEARSTGECVVFFYKTQKLDEFAAVRRKQQLKKRRLQCESKRNAVPLSYASAAKTTLDGKRGRGRAGGRGRVRGAVAAELPAPEPERERERFAPEAEEPETKFPLKLEVSKLEREDSAATDDMNCVVKESPSGMYGEGGRSAMSPTGKRTTAETPKSSISPSGHHRIPSDPLAKSSASPSGHHRMSCDPPVKSGTSPSGHHRMPSDPPLKSSTSPSTHRSPATTVKTTGGFWTALNQEPLIETLKPTPAPLLTPLTQKPTVETPKPPNLLTPLPAPSEPTIPAPPNLLTPLPPQSDTAIPPPSDLLLPLTQKSPSLGEPAKPVVNAATSPGPRMSSEPTTPASAGREQIPGLTYTNYSAWDEKEFVKAVHMFGNDPYKISDYLGTKTVGAVKMYFSRNKKRLGLENVQTVRRNPYADDATGGDPPPSPLDLPLPLVPTLRPSTAAPTPASLLQLAMPPPAAPTPTPHPSSTLVIAPLSPLPAAPASAAPDPPPQQPPADSNTQNPDRAATTPGHQVSLFQPAPGGPAGPRGESSTTISDLLLLQGDNYKHSLPDLSSLFSLDAFQGSAGSPGAGAPNPTNLLTSLPGLPGLNRAVSASAPSLFTNQPYQPPSTADPAHPARQPSASYAMEAVTPRGSDDTIAAIPTTARGRAANLWSSDEKDRFLDAFKRYGKVWQRLQEAVPSKSMAQVKTYYQNYKTKLGLDKMEVPPVPKFEAGGSSGKRRQSSGSKAAAAAAAAAAVVVRERDASADAEAAVPVAHSSYLQEAVRAWDATKDSSLPSWPALNVKEEEPFPKSTSPTQHAPSQSPHPSYHPHLTNQPSPFTSHRSTPLLHHISHPHPPIPTRPDSRDPPPGYPLLDPSHMAASALAHANSGPAGMDTSSLERLDSMLAAYIRSLPEDTGFKLTPLQWQQLMNSAMNASGQSMSAVPQELASLQSAQQHQQQQQQKLPPVPPLLRQLEDVRVLGQSIHLQPSASAAASSLPLSLPRAAPVADLTAERREQQTNALLALLGKGSIPLGALTQHHSILAPPPAPITSSAAQRMPLLDAAAALSSLGLSSMYTAAAAAAGLPPAAGSDMLSSLAQQTLLASSNRSAPHLSPLNAPPYSQPPPPAAQDYLPQSQLQHLQLLGSLNLPHSSAESALLALASASSQLSSLDNPGYNGALSNSSAAPPTRAPTPKALDLQADDRAQSDMSGRSDSLPNQLRKMSEMNMGTRDSAPQMYDLPPASMASHLPQDHMSERSASLAATAAGVADLEAAVNLYYPPAKRARYDDVHYGQEGGDNGSSRRDSMQDLSSHHQHLAAVTLLSQQSPSLTSAAQMMLQLAAGGLQLRDAAAAGNPAAAAMAAVAVAAAGRDGGKSVSRQYMEAELARYMHGSFPELDLSGNSNAASHAVPHQGFRDAGLPPQTAPHQGFRDVSPSPHAAAAQGFRDAGLPPHTAPSQGFRDVSPSPHHTPNHGFRDAGPPQQPPTSMLGLEPLRALSMLSGKKPDSTMHASLLAPPSVSAGSVNTVARQLASLPPESRSSLSLTNPELLQSLPFHGLHARSAPSSAQATAIPLHRSLQNAAPPGAERLLADLAGAGGAGLAAMQMREAGSVVSAAHLPQWLSGVAGAGLSGTSSLAPLGPGLDLNRMAPSAGMANATPSSSALQNGPVAARGAPSFTDQQPGGT